MKPSPYADILLAHQQEKPEPQKPGKPAGSPRSPYADVLLSHIQESPAGDTGYKGLTKAEIETRWRSALPSDPAKAWNMSRRESERYHMALVDVMMVGVPTFGEASLVYHGRDEIKKAIKAGRPAELAAYEYLESNFGPITAAKRRAAAEAMNALRSDLTKPVGEFLSGRVLTEPIPFGSALNNLPQIARGAAKAATNIATGAGFANWEAEIEEIEDIAQRTAATRGADMASRLLQYFIPGLGQATAAMDSFDVAGKAQTMGLLPAMADEFKETMRGINFFEPGLPWEERAVRGLGAFLGVVGLAHGIKTARDVYVDVRAGWKSDPMGALIGDAFEEAMKGDRWTSLFTEPEKGVPALGAKKAREELPKKLEQAAAEVPRLLDAAITQMASDGDPEAKEALIRSEKNGTRPAEELMAVRAESDSPFRAGQDAIWNVGESFEPVRLTALAGEKGGERFWYVEGSRAAVPESSLRPEAMPHMGEATRIPQPRKPREVPATKEAETTLVAEGIIKPIADDAIELAARRATKLDGEALPEVPKARLVKNQQGFEEVLKINFHMDAREATQMARLYGARAYAWSERTGRPEAEWWQTRLAGIADRDTVITMRDLGYDVDFRLDESAVETGRLIALSADSDVATIQRENGEIVAVPRSAIGSEIPARIERSLMSDSGEPRGVDAFDFVGKPKREGSTYIVVPFLKGERIRAELTGEPRRKYLMEQRRYEEEARKLDRENAPDQAKREAFARYRANVREIIGRPTPEEAYKKANERDYFKPGMRLETGLYGRIEIINVSSGAVRARTADGKIKMIPQHILMAEGMAREMSKPKDGVRILPEDEVYGGGFDQPGLGLANVGPRVKGLVQFLEDGRAILRAFQARDITTFVHEFGHILRREFYRGDEFTPDEVAAVERWAGAKDGNWTREAEEKFAEGFEKYLTLGKSPTRGLKALFEKFKNKAAVLYQSLTSGPSTIEIPDEVAAIFDKALGKDIDKRDAKREKEQRKADQEAEAFEAMKIDEEVEFIDYLKTIEGDDPRIDPFSEEFDPDLVDMVKAKLGGGAEDPRTPYEIILAYQEAEYKQRAVAEALSDYLADSPFIDEVVDTLSEGASGPGYHRVYNAKAGQKGNVPHLGKNIDQRVEVKTVSIGDWSPELRTMFDDWIASSYQGEGDYLLVRADQVKALRKSNEWRGNLFLPSEIVSRENGKRSVAPLDMVQEFLSYLKGEGKSQETNLYQGADEPGPKGWSDILFERHADTLAAFAEENLARFGGNHAEVRKLIERSTEGLSTRQVTEIMNRMWERTAFGRIQETYEQYGLSLQAQRKMLADEFPDLPKSRQLGAVQKALKEIGVDLATKPVMDVDRTTKRKTPSGKEVLVIGAEDVMIPADVVAGLSNAIPKWASYWSPKRVIEHIAGRTGAMMDFLVRNREEAVASLQDHLAHYRSELELRYGDKAKDRDYRMFVMMAAEGKDYRVNPEDFDPALGYPEYTIDKLKEERPSDWQQILDVAEWHRGEYDKLLDVVNNVRTRFSMGIIPKRADYFSHMAEERGVFEKIMGIEDIHEPRGGSIHAKRNSNYNQFAEQRTGERTRVDSLANFEEYLEVVLRQIHLTEPAVRHRAVARAITQKDIEGVNEDVAAYLDALANELAGQSAIPGGKVGHFILNSRYGARVEAVMRFVIARIASNTLVGNMQTALMQTAQLPIAVPIVGAKNLLTSAQTRLMVALHKLPDPSEDSSFLKRRYAYQGRISSPRPLLSRGFWDTVERRALKNDSGNLGRAMQKVGDVTESAKRVAAIPMEFVEEAIVRTIWNAAHIQSKQHGRTHEESVRYADEVTERIIGGRAIGEKPMAFNNLVLSIPMQFQLEVGNLIQFLQHDLNRDIYTGDRVPQQEYIRRVAVGLISIFVANSVYEQMFGSRPLPDPVETVIDWAGIVGHQELSPGEKVTRIAGRGLGEFISAYPLSGFFAGAVLPEKGKLIGVGLTKRELFGNSNIGEFTGGAPVTTQLRRILESRDTAAGDAAEAMSIIGLPFGGSQIRKTLTGAKAALEGEVTDKRGKTRFDVEGFDKIISILFGPYATRSGQEWLDIVKDKN